MPGVVEAQLLLSTAVSLGGFCQSLQNPNCSLPIQICKGVSVLCRELKRINGDKDNQGKDETKGKLVSAETFLSGKTSMSKMDERVVQNGMETNSH